MVLRGNIAQHKGCRAKPTVPLGSAFLLLFLQLLPMCVGAEQTTPSPTLFQHEAFTIFVPSGWKTIKSPEPGFEIGLTDGKTPHAKWYLHHEIMPEHAGEPPSDAATLRAMANQFDNLVRQQFPGAKKLTPEKRKLPGTVLVHLSYELVESGTPILREYVYLFAHRTAYVIQSTIPKAREVEVTPAIEMLFRIFNPKPGATPVPRTPDEALKNLRSLLPNLAASMPSGWRAAIKEVKFVADSPKKGDISLLIACEWPRKGLDREFVSAKQLVTSVQQGETRPASVPKETGDLVYYVGQLLGLASGEVCNLEPPVTYMTVSVFGASDSKVGTVMIRTKDLLRIISGKMDPVEAACLYQFQ